MKKGWQTRKLGDLLEVQNGYAFSSKDYSESGHFIMRIGNVQNGYVALSNPKFINLTADEKLQRFVLSEGDILVSLTGNVGRVGVIQKEHLPAALNQRVARITIKKGSPATREFLLFFLYSDWFREELIGAGHGAAQQNVSTKDLVGIQLPFPPLPEQKRIVGILNKAFAAISTAKANAEKNLQNARELFESYLQGVFANPGDGWKEKTLGEIATVKGGKRVPKGYRLETKPTKCPYIRVTDFNDNGSIDLDNIHYVNEEVYKQIKNYTISTKDLYISIAGTIGKTGIIPKELDGANLTENACKLVFKQDIEPKFVYYFTKSRDFLNQAGLNTRVAAMPKLALTRLSTIKFFLPISLTEQRSIVAKLNAFSAETKKLESIYQQKIADLDELKQSVLQKAFNGELAGACA